MSGLPCAHLTMEGAEGSQKQPKRDPVQVVARLNKFSARWSSRAAFNPGEPAPWLPVYPSWAVFPLQHEDCLAAAVNMARQRAVRASAR